MRSWQAVIQDMMERNELGAQKYNKYLDSNSPENMLQHAYEEALDLAVYLKTQLLRSPKQTQQPHKQTAAEYFFYEV